MIGRRGTSRFRFESRHEPLLPTRAFLARVTAFVGIGVSLYVAAIVVGMVGFHFLERLGWLEAALDASMILTSNGAVAAAWTPGQRLFQMAYAVLGGVVFVLVASVLLAPVIHRVLHAYHLEPEDAEEEARSETEA